jgi:hypothetical protein
MFEAIGSRQFDMANDSLLPKKLFSYPAPGFKKISEILNRGSGTGGARGDNA